MPQRSLTRTILQPFAIAIGLALIARSVVHIYSIPSTSMTPTLQPGDHIVVTPYRFGAKPERGHVVVFRHGDEVLVKRVIAVPGDLIDSRLGRPRIGGRPLDETYVQRPASTGAIQAEIVASDCYFVMGDNRDDSIDSRSWGLVPREALVGRARLILWSSNGESNAVARAKTVSRESDSPSQRAQRLFKWIE